MKLTGAAIFATLNLAAQDPIFLKGDKVLNLGVGLGSTLYSGTYYKSQVPPVSASLDIGIADNILEKGSVGVGPCHLLTEVGVDRLARNFNKPRLYYC